MNLKDEKNSIQCGLSEKMNNMSGKFEFNVFLSVLMKLGRKEGIKLIFT